MLDRVIGELNTEPKVQRMSDMLDDPFTSTMLRTQMTRFFPDQPAYVDRLVVGFMRGMVLTTPASRLPTSRTQTAPWSPNFTSLPTSSPSPPSVPVFSIEHPCSSTETSSTNSEEEDHVYLDHSAKNDEAPPPDMDLESLLQLLRSPSGSDLGHECM